MLGQAVEAREVDECCSDTDTNEAPGILFEVALA